MKFGLILILVVLVWNANLFCIAQDEKSSRITSDQPSLDQLSEEDLLRAVESMSDSNLIAVIESQGYEIDDSTEDISRQDLVDAVRAIVADARRKKIEENGLASDSIPVDTEIIVDNVNGSTRDSLNLKPDESAGSNEDVDEVENESAKKYEETRKGIHALPDDASMWDLFKAQVASDFAPFIAIVPIPVKKFIRDQTKAIKRPLGGFIKGAAGPMLKVAGSAVTLTGQGLLILGDKIHLFSASMADESYKYNALDDGN